MEILAELDRVMKSSTCLHPQSEVEAALDQMAADLTQAYANRNPILLTVVIGGMIPLGHLLTRLSFPLEVDYIHATRYQGQIKGTSKVEWKALPSVSLKGRVVIIVDDILDRGLTLEAIIQYCKNQQAAEVKTAVLVDKMAPRDPKGLQKADYVGLKAVNRYLFGYGLDYKGYLRNMPGIYAVAPEHE